MTSLKKIKYFIALFIILTTSILAQKQDKGAKEVILKMVKAVADVQSLKYNLKITERGKKGYNYYQSSVKLNRKPRKIYLYIKGIELLWVQGTNKGKALVDPNSFPYINLNLDPMGSLMRQDQHHTINEMGFDYLTSIIEHIYLKLGDKFDDWVTLEGEERINNRPCYKISINNKEFGYTNYTVGDGESLTSIARKNFISEYMIVELNPKFKDYFDELKKGAVIKIPTWYAKNVTLYIDQLYYLPIGVKVYDDKGLFEEYNYHNLFVNPKFEDAEFTRDYKDYSF